MSVFSLLRGDSKGRGTLNSNVSCGPCTEPEIDRLITQGRYGQLVRRERGESLDPQSLGMAWLALERDMAFVAAPELGSETSSEENAPAIPSLYFDRCATTNAQFREFVEDDGYSQMELWPQNIWPNLLQFVDRSGTPGPRYWCNGKPQPGKEHHPVVGVNWFEARAFALWSGKRLPTSREWEHAGSGCSGRDGRSLTARYPWGNTFSPERANTWAAGIGETVPADQYEAGATPNGIYQLVGNVWEWVATQYEYSSKDSSLRVAFEEPMVEIRGGAFDTYFETQATCQFRTGQPFLYRGHDTGFRCCLPADRLIDPPSPDSFA